MPTKIVLLKSVISCFLSFLLASNRERWRENNVKNEFDLKLSDFMWTEYLSIMCLANLQI